MKLFLGSVAALALIAAAPAYAQQHGDTATGAPASEAAVPSPTENSPPSDAIPVPGQPGRHSYSHPVVINHYIAVPTAGMHHHHMMHHRMMHHHMTRHHRMMRHHMMHHRMMHHHMMHSMAAPAAAPASGPEPAGTAPAPGASAGGLGTQGHNFPGTDNTKH